MENDMVNISGMYKKASPRIKSVVHWDLYGDHYKICPDLQKIFQEAREKEGSHYTDLAKNLNVGRKRVSECVTGLNRPIVSFTKIGRNYDSAWRYLKIYEKRVTKMRGVYEYN